MSILEESSLSVGRVNSSSSSSSSRSSSSSNSGSGGGGSSSRSRSSSSMFIDLQQRLQNIIHVCLPQSKIN